MEQSCVELSNVAVSETHGEDSPYFAGWKAYDENPYDELTNPSGVIQMGLAENQVSVHAQIYIYIQHVIAVNTRITYIDILSIYSAAGFI